jgi:hypothetical protein
MLWPAISALPQGKQFGELPIDAFNKLLQQGTSAAADANLPDPYENIILQWMSKYQKDSQLNLSIGALLKLSQLSHMIQGFLEQYPDGNILPGEATVRNWVKIFMAIKTLLAAIKPEESQYLKAHLNEGLRAGLNSIHGLLRAFKAFPVHEKIQQEGLQLKKDVAVEDFMNFSSLQILCHRLRISQPQPGSLDQQLLYLLNEWLNLDPHARGVPTSRP